MKPETPQFPVLLDRPRTPKEIAERIVRWHFHLSDDEKLSTMHGLSRMHGHGTLADAIEAALNAERERCARAICLFCAEPEHYGLPKEIEGSKRLWHDDLRNDCKGVVQCQAAAIFSRG